MKKYQLEKIALMSLVATMAVSLNARGQSTSHIEMLYSLSEIALTSIRANHNVANSACHGLGNLQGSIDSAAAANDALQSAQGLMSSFDGFLESGNPEGLNEAADALQGLRLSIPTSRDGARDVANDVADSAAQAAEAAAKQQAADARAQQEADDDDGVNPFEDLGGTQAFTEMLENMHDAAKESGRSGEDAGVFGSGAQGDSDTDATSV